MSGHYMRIAQNGTFYCSDEIGMMCAGNWPSVEGWERHVDGKDRIVVVYVEELYDALVWGSFKAKAKLKALAITEHDKGARGNE